MSPVRRRAVGGAAAVTVVLLILLAFRPVSTDRLVAGYLIALAAVALTAVARALGGGRGAAEAAPFTAALVRARPAEASASELARIERELVLGQGNAAYAHRLLLPLLRECAAARLANAHAVDLERQPARARELLGADAWELLRPDRPAPADRHGRGLSRSEIEQTVSLLEAL